LFQHFNEHLEGEEEIWLRAHQGLGEVEAVARRGRLA
jgi:hypothetical protein